MTMTILRLFGSVVVAAALLAVTAGGAVAQAQEIATRARELGFGAPLPETPEALRTPPPRGEGWYQRFQNGNVYWIPGHGAFGVAGPILAHWGRGDWERGQLGFPISAQARQQNGDLGQFFENGLILVHGDGGQAVQLLRRGEPAEPVGAFLDQAQTLQRTGVGLGRPLTAGLSPEESGPVARYQLFTAGALLQVSGKDQPVVLRRITHGPFRASGRFRLTLNGFTVNHQTSDHILEADGRGDEVYLLADVWTLERGEAVGRRTVNAEPSGACVFPAPRLPAGTSPGQLRPCRTEDVPDHSVRVARRERFSTAVMGDSHGPRNPPRVRAGSASPEGGLRSGDHFPASTPWNRAGVPRRDQLPLLLWEGELVDGANAVAILPAVWEWDGPDELERRWQQLADQTLRLPWPYEGADRGAAELRNRSPFLERDVWQPEHAGRADLLLHRHRGDGNRPVGIVPAGDGFRYTPPLLQLTYSRAAALARGTPTPYGRGIMEIRLAEPRSHNLDGDYTLYLQVEEIP